MGLSAMPMKMRSLVCRNLTVQYCQMRVWPLLLLLACTGCLDRDPKTSDHNADAVTVVARPDGPVRDEADVIPASVELTLDAKLRDVLQKKDTALIVVTVQSLQGLDIARYTNQLANQWEVGAKRGGVVLLVAPNERKVRIEVSRIVSARLSDEQCADIIATEIVPRFKRGDMPGGIRSGAEAIARHL